MAEPARAERTAGATVKKRWRAWLRAIHRDVGYLAVGFTIIYAVSGIAMNHIDDWDPNFVQAEKSLQIAPITDELTDDQAVARLDGVTGITSRPKDVFRAGDEVRLSYENGTTVTAIGANVTLQARSSRFFFRVANWLHATRGKAAWKFFADVYAALLLYLAISGIFMIKGKLGLRWRGTILVTAGFAIPLAYIVIAGGPDGQKTTAKVAETTNDGMRLLTPEENGDEPPANAKPADDEMIERPPVLRQPPPDDTGEMIARPPVLRQPPPPTDSK